MIVNLIMTVLGTDRPGLVNSLADAVSRHGGNWLESRMARLSGHFAGIVRIECPQAAAEKLIAELDGPGIPGLTIQLVQESTAQETTRRSITIDILGNDRPGIVRELSAAIAGAGGNVEELITGLESAPMSGQPMFRAKGLVSVPEHTDSADLRTAIEALSGEFTVDVT